MIDSRTSREGAAIRRRRECTACGHRFTTYEVIEQGRLMVMKRDGRREEFSREKLMAGLQKACQKRPVSQDAIDVVVQEISMIFPTAMTGKSLAKLSANESWPA